MPDKEKVIKGLECCASMNGGACRECPYSSECVASEVLYQTGTAHLAADALALLKEQEFATEFILDYYQPTCKTCGFKPFVGYIPKIEWMKERGYKYCPGCGRAVKWDD